jgi:hypothetical protein
MMWLSFTALFVVMLFLTVMFYPGDFERQETKMQLVKFTPVIFLLSWLYYLAESYLMYALSRLLGGRCEVWEMRVVNAFTTAIPGVFLGIVRLAVFFLIARKGLVTTLVDNVILNWSSYIRWGRLLRRPVSRYGGRWSFTWGPAGIWIVGYYAAAAVLPGLACLLP